MANYVFQSTKQAEKCFFQLSFLAKRHVFINRQCSHSYGGYACETKANRMAIFRVDIILKKNMLYCTVLYYCSKPSCRDDAPEFIFRRHAENEFSVEQRGAT